MYGGGPPTFSLFLPEVLDHVVAAASGIGVPVQERHEARRRPAARPGVMPASSLIVDAKSMFSTGFAVHRAVRCRPRRAHDQRHVRRLLVRPDLPAEAVLAPQEAVVARVDDHRVGRAACALASVVTIGLTERSSARSDSSWRRRTSFCVGDPRPPSAARVVPGAPRLVADVRLVQRRRVRAARCSRACPGPAARGSPAGAARPARSRGRTACRRAAR